MKTLIVLIKSTLLIALLMISTTSALAQKKVDIITLKNGNILKGKIIKQVLGDFVELETRDIIFGSLTWRILQIFVLKPNVVQELFQIQLPKPSKGMFYEIKMGVLVGSKNNKNPAPFSMILSGAYRLNPNISVGAGIWL